MIIGLTGKAGSGKDWVCQRLKRSKAYVTRFAFADQLRYEIEETLNEGVPMPALWKKPYPDEIRHLLQWWGTDLRRRDNPDYWIDKARDHLRGFENNREDTVIITDVRFPNEARLIQSMGGTLIRVWAPLETRRQRLGGAVPGDDHPSEIALDGYSADITVESKNDMIVPVTDSDASAWRALMAQIPDAYDR